MTKYEISINKSTIVIRMDVKMKRRKVGGDGEGIEKHTLSCGQDRETYTHLYKVFKGMYSSIINIGYTLLHAVWFQVLSLVSNKLIYLSYFT